MKPYDNYQLTEYDWLPEVPKHWKKRSIRTITKPSEERNGDRDDLELLSVYREYGVIRKASRDDNHNVESLNLSNYKYVGTDYLVMNKMKMWQGSLGVSSYEGIVSPAYIVCKFSFDANYRYLHYLLRSATFKTQYNRISYGIRVGQWDMRYNDFKNINLYIPSRPEQDHIVKFLDFKISKINKFIKEKKREIELLKEQKQAEINRAVTKGLNPNVPMKDSGIDWLGEIPEHWDVRRLKHLSKFILDGTHGSFSRVEDGYRLLSVRNIIDSKFVFRDDDSCVSEKHFNEISSRFLIQEGDIQLAIVGATLGKVAIVPDLPERVVTQRSLCTIRLSNDKCLNKYLFYCIQSTPFNQFLWNNAGYSAQPGVYLNTVQNASIAIPDIDEQASIVELIEEKCKKIEQLITSIQNEINTIQEYKTSLTNDVVTGKVDIRNVIIDEIFELKTLDEIGEEVEEELTEE